MALAITFTTNLTPAQYDEIWRLLREKQADHPKGRFSHVGFEQQGVGVLTAWMGFALEETTLGART